MADISKQVKQIKSAKYGRDVRQSLVDGLNAVNSAAEGSAESAEESNKSAIEAAKKAAISSEAAAGSAGAAEASANQASTSATTAGDKAEEAAGSASAAATSANQASTSATTASDKAEAAAGSAGAAEASADQASTSATTAGNKAAEAEESANDAAISAGQALSGATESENSAASARKSASLAEESAIMAESYAVGGTGTRAGEDSDNARYYKEQTQQIAGGIAGGFIPMGTIPFSELGKQTVQAGYMYNISDDFTSDDTFKDGAGIKYPAGSNVYYTADNLWDCLAGASVFGVKGNKESTYRKGMVNITPEDVGAVPTDGDSGNTTVSFKKAAERVIIKAGENLATLFGKIEKYLSDLKTVAFTGSYNDLTDKLTNFVKSGTDAKAGLVPAPSTTAGTSKFLREDGTWTTPPDTKYTLPKATGSVLGGVKTTTSNAVTDSTGLALSAVEKNASIDGTLANQIATLNNDLGNYTMKTQISNPNLLDNPWFSINQRGITSIDTSVEKSKYLADRWIFGNNDKYTEEITINNDKSLTVVMTKDIANGPTEWIVRQRFEPDRLQYGRTYTISVDVMELDTLDSPFSIIIQGRTKSGGYVSNTNISMPINKVGITSLTFVAQNITNVNYYHICLVAGSSVVNGDKIRIRAVKLESGSFSTLALDAVPNYQQELAKCQRYYRKIYNSYVNGTIFTGVGNDSTTIRTLLPFEMAQAAPAVKFNDIYAIDESKSLVKITKMECKGGINSIQPMLTMTVDSAVTRAIYHIVQNTTDGYIEISADI